MKRILFVCMGNICRSPAAEIVFQTIVDDAGKSGMYEIDSAGTYGYHTGNEPDPRMSEELRIRGYRVFGKSRKINTQDLEKFDLVLVMDEENLADVLKLDLGGRNRAKIVPFVNYLRRFGAERIPDPYYGGADGFAHVVDLLEDGCEGLLAESPEN